MKGSRSKYILSCLVLLTSCWIKAQQGNESNQALIMIIGDPVQADNSTNFNNTNPYSQTNAPPQPQQSATINTLIEPTLENGFHMRFDVGSSQSVEQISSSSYSTTSSGNGSGKSKKLSSSITQKSFNFKKRIKSWLPKRKKKYRPHLCGRF